MVVVDEQSLKEVTLTDILGDRAFTEVKIGEEAVFLHYLNKSLKERGFFIDLMKFKYVDEVLKSAYFSLVARENRELIKLVEEKGSVLANVNHIQPKFFNKSLSNIELRVANDSPNHLIFSENESTDNVNKVVYGGYSSFAYVALVAEIMVQAYIGGMKVEKITLDNRVGYYQAESFFLLPNLVYWGNQVFLRMLDVLGNTSGSLDEAHKNFYDQCWVAYFYMLNQLGYANDHISIKDKYNHLKQNYHEGMPVFLYRRVQMKKNTESPKKKIAKVQLAIVRSVSERQISLEILRNLNTKIGRIISREEGINNSEQGDLYTMEYEDLLKLNSGIEVFDLTTIGVDHLIYHEELFIMPINNTDDVEIYLQTSDDGSGKIRVQVDTLDYVYTMLEEWEVEYDRIKFLADNFAPKGRTPVYEKYREFNTTAKIMSK